MSISAWMLVLKLDECVILNRVSRCFSNAVSSAVANGMARLTPVRIEDTSFWVVSVSSAAGSAAAGFPFGRPFGLPCLPRFLPWSLFLVSLRASMLPSEPVLSRARNMSK